MNLASASGDASRLEEHQRNFNANLRVARRWSRFETERAALRPLPDTPYDTAIWKQVKLHRDCHVVFERAYYPVPRNQADG
jgi:hypothetical protein